MSIQTKIKNVIKENVLSVRLDDQQVEKLKKISSTDDRPASYVVRKAIDFYIEHLTKCSMKAGELRGDGNPLLQTHINLEAKPEN